MKQSTKRTIKIWVIGIFLELAYAGIIYGLNKLFGLTMDSMIWFITSSLILSVCLYLDKFHTPKKKPIDTDTAENIENKIEEETAETPETLDT